jgi:hypothetical protein
MQNRIKVALLFTLLIAAPVAIFISQTSILLCTTNYNSTGDEIKSKVDSSKIKSDSISIVRNGKYFWKYTETDLKIICYENDTSNKTILEVGFWKPMDSSLVIITEIPDYHGDYSEICLLQKKNNELKIVARGYFEEQQSSVKSKSTFSFPCDGRYLDTTLYCYHDGKYALAFYQCFPGSFDSPLYHDINMMKTLYLFQINANKISLMGEFITESFDDENTWEDSARVINHFNSKKNRSIIVFSSAKTNGFYDIYLYNLNCSENDSEQSTTKTRTIYKWDKEFYQKTNEIIIFTDTIPKE